jgi:hypothetical protein
MGCFSGVFSLSENDLNEDFRIKHGSFLNNNRRGYGYFIWKPQVILQGLNRIPENSFLLYADAGCTLRKEGIPRLETYIEQANQHNIFTFRMGFKECHWTKMDVLIRLDFTSEEEMNSEQRVGTTHIWKNTPVSRDLLSEWIKISEYYPNINDSPSISKNHSEFKEHRHDQSLLSVLLKKHGFPAIPDETWWNPNWTEHVDYPIHATRLKF